MIHFHVSDMKAFSNCRLQWNFSSHIRMGREPKTPSRALRMGTLVHKILEVWYTFPGVRIDDCVDGAVKELNGQEIEEEARAIARNYALWAKAHDNFEVLALEQDFAIPLFDDHQFAGRWDMLVQHEGKIWINDFKTTGSYFEPYAEYLQDHDEQARAYSWAGKQIYGDDFGGIMFTMIKNKPPELPIVLKDGSPSRNKNQKTSWEFYRAAILAAKRNLLDYEDMQVHFQRNPFIQRIAIRLGDRALKAFHERAVYTGREMLSPDLYIYPNANPMNCRMCAFRLPCSVYHSIDAKAAERILFTEYGESRYAREAGDVDKEDLISV